MPLNKKTLAVLGAGISGLSAAYRFRKLCPDATLRVWDRRERTGGVLTTLHRDGYQIEQSADNFITTVPYLVSLCRELGIADELISTNPRFRRTYVVRKKNLYLLPDGFLMLAPSKMYPLAITPILSPSGKLRAALEYFIPPSQSDDDETMKSFVTRRLGREVFERLVEPLVSGVYAADMNQLSLMATLPRFREMERQHGSLIRAMRYQMKINKQAKSQSQESGARYSMFVTLRGGLSRIADTLAANLPNDAIQLNKYAEKLESFTEESGNLKWRITDQNGFAESYDAVIFATPSYETARLLTPTYQRLGGLLAGIEHSGTAIITLAFDASQVKKRLSGMGFVVPKIENSPILAGSFSSMKYEHRAPEGKQLIRVFAGGARSPEMADMSDEQLLPLVKKELRPLLKIDGEPELETVAHWQRTMPQYHLGHLERIREVNEITAKIPHLALAGNFLEGVGIPVCSLSGQNAAEQIVEKMRWKSLTST
ncbi:MAG: protoporphyrinogen oxidase [Planctomycetaceae bacterium]|jgi:oxygen-dependent protoporphyrinogen oxidase|nr:protoporphyrinogen oxidase [Planctomycetaceae bacterium]